MAIIHRQDLKNGDLIGWRRPQTPGKTLWLDMVRLATLSEFGHVSIVWNLDSGPGHVEATQPCIRRAPIPPGEAYVIPMNLNLSDAKMNEFFHDKLGLSYSFRDALMGYFGMLPSEDDRWQCAELSLEFLRNQGLILPDAYTPSRLMRRTLRHTEGSLSYLQN